jgi:hypothetical protein
LGKQLVDKHRKGEHKGIRLVTTIDDKGGDELIKIPLKDGFQIKDIRNIPPMNFSISDKEMHATIEMDGGRMDAKDKIGETEEGIELSKIEIIQNPIEGIERFNSLINSASHEGLRIFP